MNEVIKNRGINVQELSRRTGIKATFLNDVRRDRAKIKNDQYELLNIELNKLFKMSPIDALKSRMIIIVKALNLKPYEHQKVLKYKNKRKMDDSNDIKLENFIQVRLTSFLDKLKVMLKK